MTITAKVIAHSRADNAPDLITLQLRYPRFIHAEFMTHRVFSRNASSSRAIPIERMIQDVIDDPAMPVAWGSNKPGMQAGDEVSAYHRDCAKSYWLSARDEAVDHANSLVRHGLHKQIVNRLLEPFGHISVVCTATDWQNFFDLRCHPDADPTMKALADAMREAIEGSEAFAPEITPTTVFWHLPYVTSDDFKAVHSKIGSDLGMNCFERALAMISAARCARVSYLNHDGSNPDIEKDLALAERLLASKHMSPFEHQARVTGDDGTALWGNFTGWDQHRKMLELS